MLTDQGAINLIQLYVAFMNAVQVGHAELYSEGMGTWMIKWNWYDRRRTVHWTNTRSFDAMMLNNLKPGLAGYEGLQFATLTREWLQEDTNGEVGTDA